MENPYDLLHTRLDRIEKAIQRLLEMQQHGVSKSGVDLLRYIPVRDIFKNKICSESTFYAHARAGEFEIYKFGNLSFVDREEFEKAFKAAGLTKVATTVFNI